MCANEFVHCLPYSLQGIGGLLNSKDCGRITMKTMKVALLATAALAAISASARADDTAAIKAQLEALTARIAQLEATPSVPTGYSLLTISEGLRPPMVPGLDGLHVVMAIPPRSLALCQRLTRRPPPFSNGRAMPAPQSSITITNLKVMMIVMRTIAGADNGIDVVGRGQLKVVGKTDTAVGEVGAQLEIRGNIGRRERSRRRDFSRKTRMDFTSKRSGAGGR